MDGLPTIPVTWIPNVAVVVALARVSATGNFGSDVHVHVPDVSESRVTVAVGAPVDVFVPPITTTEGDPPVVPITVAKLSRGTGIAGSALHLPLAAPEPFVLTVVDVSGTAGDVTDRLASLAAPSPSARASFADIDADFSAEPSWLLSATWTDDDRGTTVIGVDGLREERRHDFVVDGLAVAMLAVFVRAADARWGETAPTVPPVATSDPITIAIPPAPAKIKRTR